MFESQNYKVILARMLAKVPETFDKREGSIIYDAFAPAAAELAQAYIDLDIVLDEGFAETASLPYLILRSADRGITQNAATAAVLRGVFNINVDIGTRFTGDTLIYIVTEKISEYNFKLQCETAGTAGNKYVGTIIPVNYIAGLATAELTELLIPGEDAEDTKSLLARYLQKAREPATSGNAAQYRQWALEVAGVGDARVFPLWNGDGTVKVVVLAADMLPAGQALLDEVSAYIDSRHPIGAAVTIAAGSERQIAVTTVVSLMSGYILGSVQAAFISALGEYLASIAFKEQYVSYAKIGSILLATTGVKDYSSLSVNGAADNIDLGEEGIPVVGVINLAV